VGTKNLNLLVGVDTGVNYRITKNITLGGNISYYGNRNSVGIFDVGLSIGANLK
jgi:hypothetical protein